MADKRVVTRMTKELERLKKDPPHGITCWPVEGRLNHLEAKLLGGEDTPYEGGIFKLEIKIPHRYPFEPPHVQFQTKIYHPNIDSAGRICLDVLKSPPTGSWKPAHNLHTILTSIQLLLAEPNPDDGLMVEISSEYKHQRPAFLANARKWTRQYARNGGTNSGLGEEKEETLLRETEYGQRVQVRTEGLGDMGTEDNVLEVGCGRGGVTETEDNHRRGVKRKRVTDDEGIRDHKPSKLEL